MTKMVGLMWDSTTPEIIPGWARLKALYINGKFATHPDYGRGRVFIDVNGAAPFAAEILDVEKGNATPEHVPGWLQERARTEIGTVYCNQDTLPHVLAAAGSQEFDLWLATLDGSIPSLDLPPHVELVAVQAIGAGIAGGNVDISAVVSQRWWNSHALPAIR